MARKIYRYKLTVAEQKLWDAEEMEGWRGAMRGCVEDEAREEGCTKFVLSDRSDIVVAKGDVPVILEPEVVEA